MTLYNPPLEIVLLLACLATLLAFWARTARHQPTSGRRLFQAPAPSPGARNIPKPPWIHEEVLRLKALMPHHRPRVDRPRFPCLSGVEGAAKEDLRHHPPRHPRRDRKLRRTTVHPYRQRVRLHVGALSARAPPARHPASAHGPFRALAERSRRAFLQDLQGARQPMDSPRSRTPGGSGHVSPLVQPRATASTSRRAHSRPAMERQGAGSIEAGVLLLGMGWALDRFLLPVVTDRVNDDRCGGRQLSAALRCLGATEWRPSLKKDAMNPTLSN